MCFWYKHLPSVSPAKFGVESGSLNPFGSRNDGTIASPGNVDNGALLDDGVVVDDDDKAVPRKSVLLLSPALLKSVCKEEEEEEEGFLVLSNNMDNLEDVFDVDGWGTGGNPNWKFGGAADADEEAEEVVWRPLL